MRISTAAVPAGIGPVMRQCFQKYQHTEGAAIREAKRMHKKMKAKFNAYLCPHCGAWHVGRDRSWEAASRRGKAMGASGNAA